MRRLDVFARQFLRLARAQALLQRRQVSLIKVPDMSGQIYPNRLQLGRVINVVKFNVLQLPQLRLQLRKSTDHPIPPSGLGLTLV